MERILVMNLTPRWWMLHYSSQFCNEVSSRKNLQLKVAIASYHNSTLYDNKIKFIKIRTNPNYLSFIFDSLNIFYHIYFIFKIYNYKPEIVHFIDNHPRYIIYSKVFRLLWYKIYVTQHDPLLHSWEADTILWKISSRVNFTLRNISDKLFVHGDNLKKYVIEKCKIDKNKVYSIKHWSYTFFNRRAKWLEVNKDYFLFFWRIQDYKWIDVLLDSLNIVKNSFPNFKLIIAWPWNLQKYSYLLKKYRDNIEIFNKNIEPDEAYKYFEISEFVVLPYKDATWTWVIPVAYSFSKAVLVTDVWELPSAVVDTKTWYIIKLKNSKALWEKIVEMLKEKDKVTEMWLHWKEYSDKYLSRSEIIDKIYW